VELGPFEKITFLPPDPLATGLKEDDANGGDGGVTVVSCASLAAGGRLIN